MAEISRTDVDVSTAQTLTNKTLTSARVNQLNDTGGATALVVTPTASGVNHVTVKGSASGSVTSIVSATGSDTNIFLSLRGKGTFGPVLAAGTSNILVCYAAASSVNYIQLDSKATGGSPSLSAVGSDTNINLNLISKGSGEVQVNGNTVATKVGVPASAAAAGKPGQWAADASYIYAYTGDGTSHSWVRASAGTW